MRCRHRHLGRFRPGGRRHSHSTFANDADSVETSIGALKFRDGIPDTATAGKLYDQLDLQRGVSAFLNGLRGVSIYAARQGIRDAGVKDNEGVLIFSGLMDSKSLFLTANADTVYFLSNIDLTKGPMVVETPPDTLGLFDDLWFRWVIDFGAPGPDRGMGGKYLLLPPGYDGPLPDGGYFVGPHHDIRRLAGACFLGEQRPEAGRGCDQEHAQDLSLRSGILRHEHGDLLDRQRPARRAEQARHAAIYRGHRTRHEHDPAQRFLLLRDARCAGAGATGRSTPA